MDQVIIDVPVALMRQTQVLWDIDWRGGPAQEDLAGNTATVMNAFPRWIGEPDFRLGRAQIAAWRALRWRGEGRVNLYRLTMFDPAVAVPDDLDTTVPAAAAAVAGDQVLQVTVSGGVPVPVVGQILSHDDWPVGVVSVATLGSGVYTLGVRPALRTDVAISDPVRLVGQGLFQAASDDSGRISYGANLTAAVKWKFVEVLSR